MISCNWFGYCTGIARRTFSFPGVARPVRGGKQRRGTNPDLRTERAQTRVACVCVCACLQGWCVSAGTASQARPRLSPFLLIKAA